MDEKEIDQLDSEYGDAEEYEDNPDVFRIRDPLDPPEATVLATKKLHQLIHEGHIDLSPPYQRGVVWNQEKQIALIESIFRNFYIPPVLFFVREDDPDEIEPLRICMDGKQRLSAIQAFIDGQIPYRDPVTKRKFFYTVPLSQSKRKALIPQQYKDQFDAKEVTCVEFRNIAPSIERDIFQRVQMGVTLTTAEKLAAISTPYADWITDLDAKHIRSEDGLTYALPWDTRRGKHFQCLAQMVYAIERLPDRSAITSAKIGSWLQGPGQPDKQFKQKIEDVLNTYYVMATKPKLNAPFKTITQIVSPVEFVFIGVLLYVMMDADEETKSTEILNMRQYVRALHKDVRANNRVVGSLWDFIEEVQNRFTWATQPRNNNINGKRKRTQTNGHDDEKDIKATPIKSLGVASRRRKITE